MLAALSVVVLSEFIFDDAPSPSCHAATLDHSQGRLVAAWFGGKNEGASDVGIWLAHRTPEGWSKPRRVAEGREDGKPLPCWNPVLFQADKGPLMLFYKVGPSPAKWWGMLKTSADGGETWSDERRLPEGILGPIKNRPIQLADGTILSPSSTEHNGWRIHFERSNDGGATWTKTPPYPADCSAEAIQPSILRKADGSLLAIGRTRQGKVFDVASHDQGVSWTDFRLGELPNPNSGTDALTLADGRHVIAFNPTPDEPGRWLGKRSPLTVAVSEDGRNWRVVANLEHEPGQEFSYPSLLQTPDGMLHCVYTWKRQRIRHAVLDPKRF